MTAARSQPSPATAAQAALLAEHPTYANTLVLDELRRTDYARLDRLGYVYLDFTGGGLYAEAQLREHMRLLETGVFGNPHSINPTSAAFSGVQHPLEWIEQAHAHGWDVLLDAGAYVPTNRLDLSRWHPDYVAISFYKMFGWPTGVGCLFARRQALAKLQRPWFSGGTIVAAFVGREYYQSAPGAAHFEDGTVNYLGLPAVEIGLLFLDPFGIDTIHARVSALAALLLETLGPLSHSDGAPAATIYGPRSSKGRGATIAFNFLHPDGRVVDERYVDRVAAAHNISLCTGCFCNPGAGEVAFTIPRETLVGGEFGAGMTLEDYIRAVGLPSGGAIRASLGLVSNVADLERFTEFASEFLDLTAVPGDFPPRIACCSAPSNTPATTTTDSTHPSASHSPRNSRELKQYRTAAGGSRRFPTTCTRSSDDFSSSISWPTTL